MPLTMPRSPSLILESTGSAHTAKERTAVSMAVVSSWTCASWIRNPKPVVVAMNSAQTTAPQALPMETRRPVMRPAMLEGNTTSVMVPRVLAPMLRTAL